MNQTKSFETTKSRIPKPESLFTLFLTNQPKNKNSCLHIAMAGVTLVWDPAPYFINTFGALFSSVSTPTLANEYFAAILKSFYQIFSFSPFLLERCESREMGAPRSVLQ